MHELVYTSSSPHLGAPIETQNLCAWNAGKSH